MTAVFAALDVSTDPWEIALRLVLAAAFGAAAGWERETKGHTAGLRTYLLVALGAAGFTLLGLELAEQMGESRVADPARIIGSVVGGIGFLGAGAIIQSGGRVHGLTTAAGMWVIAAVGVSVGAGAYVLAGMMTVLVLLALAVLQRVEARIHPPSESSGSSEGAG